VGSLLVGLVVGYVRLSGSLERWMRHRSEPVLAARSLHRRIREEGIADE